MIVNRRSFQLSIVAAALLAGIVPAAAQSYPSRPIRLIVGFAAGGPTDVLARIIGGKMSEILGQQVVIENRTGASGNIATQFVVRAPNDGYTILMGANSNAVNESLFKNLGFNFAKDLVPVAPLAEAPTVLVVHPSLEVKSVRDLIDLAKAKPGEIMYATAGKGTTTHLAGELFNLMADVKLTAGAVQGQRRDHQGSAVGPDQGDVLARPAGEGADRGRQAARRRLDRSAPLRAWCRTCRRSPKRD